MKDIEATNIAVVRKYFDGCNTGNLEDLLSTLTPDVFTTSCRHRFRRSLARSTSPDIGESTNMRWTRSGRSIGSLRAATKSSTSGVACGLLREASSGSWREAPSGTSCETAGSPKSGRTSSRIPPATLNLPRSLTRKEATCSATMHDPPWRRLNLRSSHLSTLAFASLRQRVSSNIQIPLFHAANERPGLNSGLQRPRHRD